MRLNLLAIVLLLSFVLAQDDDISNTKTVPDESAETSNQGSTEDVKIDTEAEETGPGIITFILGLDWT